MKVSANLQVAIEYPCICLPQNFYQGYPVEVLILLQDQDDGLPGALLL